jgi:hypothetical protein
MPQGRALLIGLNRVDAHHYGGWAGELNACEADAMDLTEIAKSQGFTTKQLLTKAATREHVINEIKDISQVLKPGDIFMLYYSGHGGQVPDKGNEEKDLLDETWCLYDGEIIDDEVNHILSRFSKNVRILVLSDSCHSGTMVKAAYYHGMYTMRLSMQDSQMIEYKYMPSSVALRTYRQNKGFYDKILQDTTLVQAKDKVKASVLLMSGCQDNQFSMDGVFNSLFTATLLRVWNNGAFDKDYRAFHKEIVEQMPPDQTPNYYWLGPQDAEFEKQKPFTV